MAPSYDTIGFLARDAALFRAVGRVLLDAERAEAEPRRLIVAQDMFARADKNVAEALRQVLDEIGGAFSPPERLDVAGSELDSWRNAFRIIQSFELQTTLLPFALSHADGVGSAIRERLEIASHVTREVAETALKVRAAAAGRLCALAAPGTLIVMPTAPTLPPERNIPDGDATLEFRALTLGSTCIAGHAGLPQISIPAAIASGCPAGLSFIGWAGGDEALLDLAVRLEPLLAAKP